MTEQLALGNDFLPELDRKATQRAVEDALEKYRICKYLSFDEREASTTQLYEERFHGPTGTTSDQTASVAIHNVDASEARRRYCQRIENAVKRLPRMERFLIEKRYMCEDAQYITDYHVYCFEFSPPISAVTYGNIRWRAFYKLALSLNIQVAKEDKSIIPDKQT